MQPKETSIVRYGNEEDEFYLDQVQRSSPFERNNHYHGTYEVYYQLVRENRLRALRDQGMTELFLPLPGTQRLMVCPLELMLRRGSGADARRLVLPTARDQAKQEQDAHAAMTRRCRGGCAGQQRCHWRRAWPRRRFACCAAQQSCARVTRRA